MLTMDPVTGAAMVILFSVCRLQCLQMGDALQRQLCVVILRSGIPIRELTYQHSNTPVRYVHWNSSPMANSHLVTGITGTSHHCGNVRRVFIMSTISASDHASSSYIDYDAFVMIGSRPFYSL